MDPQELTDLPARTCVYHALFGAGVTDAPRSFDAVVIDFFDHGLKELQIAFAGHKLERHQRPQLHEELEILTRNGRVRSATVAEYLEQLIASGEEPEGFFGRRGLLLGCEPIEYDELAEETVMMDSNRGKDFKMLVKSMMRATSGRGDPMLCLVALKKALS